MLSKTVTSLSNTLCMITLLVYISITCSAANAVTNGSEEITVDPANSVMALTLQNIAAQVDTRINSMKILANTIANDTHIHQWVEQGFTAEAEALLIDKLGYLVDEYQLTSASFADTQSNKYWNHEGFLRVLQPDMDKWYFTYLASSQQDLISVYHDKNKHRVDLYVNYKQPNGNGLSGIATSFDGVVALLTASSINQNGEVFIVDKLGVIQLHADPTVAGEESLQQRYSDAAAQVLLTKASFNQFELTDVQSTQQLLSSYIPSMGWYVVAQINTYEQ